MTSLIPPSSTALHIAAIHNRLEVASYLLEIG